MKKILLSILFVFIFTVFISAENKLFQYSTINALMIGQYDGHLKINDLKKHGNFGIGTFDKLDGEMIFLNNEFYQFDYKGKVNKITKNIKTPFAAVTFFETDIKVDISYINSFEDLQKKISSILPTHNIFFAIKITGDFDYIKTRSVPSQEKPYPRLVEVAKNQPRFEYQNVSGNLIGFYTPEYIVNVNVPGYHLHFLSENKTGGGHLLNCKIRNAVLEISYINGFEILLPDNKEFYNNDLLNIQKNELEKTEKEKSN